MAITYTTDIKPLFRAKDISCMAPMEVKLGDADWMCDPTGRDGFQDHANARMVFSVLSAGDMPPDGPWPQSRLDLFGHWIEGGCVR